MIAIIGNVLIKRIKSVELIGFSFCEFGRCNHKVDGNIS